MEEIITYLQMTSADELNPARPVPGMVLERIDRASPLIAATQVRIGAPHGWPSAVRSDEEWTEWLSHPLRQYWSIRYENELAGITDLEPQSDGEVEITTFGLLPEFVGRGLGGHALTLTVRQAWAVEPLGAASVSRVWLHTSTMDHPNALANYRRRGFRPYRTRVRRHDDA
ncbi:GNAT family N-acetyltransferase [Actinomadura sp. HBU206391]|uniref:GNAT family N-acetyltransferase n=1 Tax=Actinomadura sp. HBU206391 TaxID=2731692 RepID=UPI0016502B22|nr:GNAT family N-acetyltransferase [Actinomadura sp. HBU206391]MBC6459170.1 GNAT family N-acetyltransferase [Actinomadura sp. HBU206391]